MSHSQKKELQSFTAPQDVLAEFAEMAEDETEGDVFGATAKSRQVAARETEYQRRRFDRQEGTGEDQSYAERMRVQNLEKEEERVRRYKEDLAKNDVDKSESADSRDLDKTPPRKVIALEGDSTPPKSSNKGLSQPETALQNQLESELAVKSEDQPRKRRSRWDIGAEVSQHDNAAIHPPKRSRWDQAPTQGATDQIRFTVGSAPDPSSSTGASVLTGPEDARNKYITDAELNMLLPSEGYIIVTPPPGYTPVHKHLHPTGSDGSGAFMMQDESAAQAAVAAAGGLSHSEPTEIEGVGSLAFFKAEDATYFSKILGDGAKEESDIGLTVEELKEKKIMRLLLKIKNGTPASRKVALRTITDKAREFGAGPLFDKILPLLMEQTLEDQERHLLVKVIDRVLYKLDDLVRPYVHKILVVIEPLLIDADYYARVEGREIISNLAKASGLAHMISTMRPDIDHVDEYVRNTTSRAFAVVASALGIPALLPFLKAVCRSKSHGKLGILESVSFNRSLS